METRPRKAYSVAEAAELLSVSQWSIREACRRGEIRCVRLGRRIIIPADALDELLAAAENNHPDAGASSTVGTASAPVNQRQRASPRQ